ncbi:MAG: aconitate hydratase, partial [Deltaproteobacteria bacterium]|nr:aconitate hydratase [Deltaproteobacteria bacterium]
MANLVNFGIVPLTFENPDEYKVIDQGDHLELIIGDLRRDVTLKNRTKDRKINLKHTLSELDAEILKAGGKLPWVRTQV